jgi:hypothetical protein
VGLRNWLSGGVRSTIDEADGTFTVSFVDAAGTRHASTFHSRAAAKAFARAVRKLPADESFDRSELSVLVAQSTGIARNPGGEFGILPPK